MSVAKAPTIAARWYDTMGVARVHRAYVSLPYQMTAADRPLQERVVFFEVPDGAKPWEHLWPARRAAALRCRS
jgi:hypothetical protein